MSKPPPNNPYQKAAKNYDAQSSKQASPRETEAKALLKTAKQMQDIQNNWPEKTDSKHNALIEQTLNQNRQIWVLFYDHALEEKSAAATRSMSTNIASLAGFVFKKTIDVMANPAPEKFNVLININREVANGLMTKKDASASS